MLRALQVQSNEAQSHVHGFHSYPARLHPGTAAALIEGLTHADATVLDPFCGSGTTLVEARRLGRRGIGSDLNPLALELCWLKTLAASTGFLRRLSLGAERVCEFGEDRRLGRTGPIARYAPSARRAFPVHVLLELDSLWHGLSDEPDASVRRALSLVFSSILTKVSRQASDTSRRQMEPRLRSGYTLQLFAGKTRELRQRLHDYSTLLPDRSHSPKLYERDARQLSIIEDQVIDFVVTSPPYPGVFDYLEHHSLRLNFLQLTSKTFKAREIGARRNYQTLSFSDATRRWRSELLPCLKEVARVLKPGGKAALVVADSVVGGKALLADRQLADWAPSAGLQVLLCASQSRPSFHHKSDRVFRQQPRAEHLLLLERLTTGRTGSSRSAKRRRKSAAADE